MKAPIRLVLNLYGGSPRGTLVALTFLLAETGFAIILAWLGLWGFGATPLARSYAGTATSLFGIMFLMALGPQIFIQHMGRFRRLQQPPFRQTLYKFPANLIGLLVAISGLVGIIVLGLFALTGWKLLFHWSALVFYVVWSREIAPSKEQQLALQISHFGRRSATSQSLVLNSRTWTSQLAGLISLELGAFLFWTLFHSMIGVAIYCVFGVVVVGGLSALIFGSAASVARGARREFAIGQEVEGKS